LSVLLLPETNTLLHYHCFADVTLCSALYLVLIAVARALQVRNAMNEINASKRLKESAFQRAEGEKILKVWNAWHS
jgi:hypothetical protein